MIQQKYGERWKEAFANWEQDEYGHGGMEEEVDESPERFEFDEIEKKVAEVKHFVDLEGGLISKRLDEFVGEVEGIPREFGKEGRPYK